MDKTKKASTEILNPNSGLGTPDKSYAAPAGVTQDLALTDILVQPKEDLTQEIGRSGVLVMNGLIINEEYNRDLTGQAGAKKYDEMRRSDSSIQAALKALKLPLLAANYHVKKNEGDPESLAVEKQEFIHKNLFVNLDFSNSYREMLTCLEQGYSVFEKTFEFGEKGRVEIAKFGFRKQSSIYRWQMGNGQPGIQQYLLSGGFRDIPDYKLTLFSPEKEGDNYAGISVLRSCYKDWYMKDLLVKINAMSHERHGIGTPKITVKGQVSPDEQIAMREAARNMRAGDEAYIETTENIDFEILDMKANSREPILPSIEFHTKQIFQSILAQFLQLSQSAGGGGSGSRALSEDMSKLFMHSLEYLADYMCNVITNDLIKDLIELNWGKGANYPTLEHEQIGDDNISFLGDAYSKIANAGGITNTVETEQYLRTMLGLPVLTDDEVKAYTVPVTKSPLPFTANEMKSIKALDEKISNIIGL